MTASHPALAAGKTAVVTGAASGIGLGTAKRFAHADMNVCLADLAGEKLALAAEIAAIAPRGAAAILTVPTDVSHADEVRRLHNTVAEHFGAVDVLMNNAGISLKTTAWSELEHWRKMMEVNLWGVVNCVQAFVPDMVARNRPALIINTGSKQGITNPPGNVGYNVAKAGVRFLTEQLAHELRAAPNCRVQAHLLIPGFTFTGLTRASEKPAAAWTPEQVVDFMIESIADGQFYILCPDNDVTRTMDERRMQWAADDIIKNRPALSRWHPDFRDRFETFMAG